MASKHQSKVINEYKKKGYYVINLIKTNKNGIPDLLCLKDGEKPLFIECKELKDTLKPLQKFRIDELKSLGFDAFVSTSEETPF
jgi:Holliday junction resolvase